MEFLWPLAFGAVVLLGLNVVPRIQARRRRTALSSGDAATFRVRLAGTAVPYPQSPRRGVLRISADRMTWTARGGGPVLDLTASGLRPTGLRDPRGGDSGGQNEMVLTAADAVGTAVRLVGLTGTVQNLHEVLTERAAPSSPGPATVLEPGSRRHGLLLLLPACVLLLSVVGGAFTTWTLTTGVRVTGTVVSEDDDAGYCDVRWVDPRDGSELVNGVECYFDVGEQVPLIALADPLRGEVVASEDPWFWGVVSAGVALSALGWGAWLVRARRRDDAAPSAPSATVAPPPALSEQELDYSTVKEATRARAAADGWGFDGSESTGDSRLLDSPRRAFAFEVFLVLWPLLGALVFAALIGWTALAGMWASLGDTARATAAVTDEPFETFPFAPEDLEVRIPLAEGREQTTLVAVRGLPDPVPETLEVEYSVASPYRARAVEYDGAPRGAALSGAVLAVGLCWTGWQLWSVLAARRAQRLALRHGKHALRYVLTAAPDGTCFLLLYWDGPASRPAFVLGLADDVRGRFPGAGVVELHGKLAPGEVVVARTGGRELPLASPLLDVEPEEAVHLVNGTEPSTL